MATSKSPMDMVNQLSIGQKLIAGGGIALLIFSFLPWHHYSFGSLTGIPGVPGSINRSAWQSPDAIWSLLAVLLGVAMVVAVLGPAFANLQLPNLGSVTWGQAMLGAGAAVLILVIVKFLAHSGSLGFGFYLGFIASVVIAAGGYLLYSEERAGAGTMR
jgi:hypothetical protein